ncbi:hypothetical protein P2868_14295 [Lactiplantibacillus plantarum]|nr:hypothetical protein [Lactiplantibacillus plantarum]MDF3265948.1 hypothetical protein [Lactiplantibacillus plantarum]
MERRIAIIADVHGNYTAFKAVRDDIVKNVFGYFDIRFDFS